MLNPEQSFQLEGCRSFVQYAQLRASFEPGTDDTHSCIFCHPDPTINMIEWEDEHVMAWHVHKKYMRLELRLHYLIVPRRHSIRFMHEMTDAEALSMHAARRFMANKFNYQGGLTHTREGPMHLNAGTVRHLHENAFEADTVYIEMEAQRRINNGDNELIDVRVPVFKDPRDRAKNKERAARFSTIYEQGITPDGFAVLVSRGDYDKGGTRLVP